MKNCGGTRNTYRYFWRMDRYLLRNKFLIVLTIVVFLITYLPYLMNRIYTPPEKVFTEGLIFPSDYGIYFAFIKQAAAGQWLFENQMTPEKHHPVFFNLHWLILGKIQWLFQLPMEVLFHLWRALAAAVLFGAFYFLSGIFAQNLATRRVALLALATGGGMGWFFAGLEYFGGTAMAGRWEWGGSATADTFAAIHPFMQVFRSPFHALSTGLLLLTLGVFFLSERRGAFPYYLGAGLLCALLGTSRPHEMGIAVLTISLYTLWQWRQDGRITKRTIARLAVIAMALPLFLYYVYLTQFHPIFKWAHSQNSLRPLLPLNFVLSAGLVSFFAVANTPWLARRLLRSDPGYTFLASWIAATLLLFYSYPLLRYSAEFGTGLMPPLVILAVSRFDSPMQSFKGRAAILIGGLLCVNALTSGWLVYAKSLEWQDQNSAAFLDEPIQEGLMWLSQHSRPSDVVLAAPEVGLWIPRYAGTKVFIANPVPTMQFAAKQELLKSFYDVSTSETFRVDLLRRFDIRYLFHSPYEQRVGPFEPETMPNLVRTYSNGVVKIYEVRWRDATPPVSVER